MKAYTALLPKRVRPSPHVDAARFPSVDTKGGRYAASPEILISSHNAAYRSLITSSGKLIANSSIAPNDGLGFLDNDQECCFAHN